MFTIAERVSKNSSDATRLGFLANVVERGLQLMEGLRRIFGPTHEVRGKGLLVGVQLQQPPAELVKAALAEGLVVGIRPASDVLRGLAGVKASADPAGHDKAQ